MTENLDAGLDRLATSEHVDIPIIGAGSSFCTAHRAADAAIPMQHPNSHFLTVREVDHDLKIHCLDVVAEQVSRRKAQVVLFLYSSGPEATGWRTFSPNAATLIG